MQQSFMRRFLVPKTCPCRRASKTQRFGAGIGRAVTRGEFSLSYLPFLKRTFKNNSRTCPIKRFALINIVLAFTNVGSKPHNIRVGVISPLWHCLFYARSCYVIDFQISSEERFSTKLHTLE